MNHDDKIKEVMGLVDEYANACEHDLAATYHGQVSPSSAEKARDAIESKLREMVQIPSGYALVPVEPTEEMFVDGMEEDCLGRPSVDDETHVLSIWKAMLSAAPTPNTSADALKGL